MAKWPDEAVAGAMSALNDVSIVADNTLAELSARTRTQVTWPPWSRLCPPGRVPMQIPSRFSRGYGRC